MAAVEKEDIEQVRAAQILINLRYRKLQRWPEWVLMQPSDEASSSSGTTLVAAKVMPPSGEACSSVRTVAAAVPPQRQLPEWVSMHSSEAYFSLAGTIAAGVPERWPKAKRSRPRGETSNELPKHGHAAVAAKGSGAPRSTEQERCAEMRAASAQRRTVVAALSYVAVVGSGSDPSTSVAPAKEPMKTPSPNSPLDLDCGARGSGMPSSANDAAPSPARPQAKRKGTGTLGSIDGDGEGCSSPAKRGPVAQEEKPMPISVEPNMQSEIRASNDKGAPLPFPFDLNLLPMDEDAT